MDLMKIKKKMTNEEAVFFIKQILDGVQYLHEKKIIHRDLKLGNLFLNDHLEVKIGDFGLATNVDFEGQRKKTLCGTPNYIAPEILENQGHSFEVDVWSIGVILYTLLCGTPPFETLTVKTTYKKIKDVDFTFPDHICQEAKDLIQKILVFDPKKRPSVAEIKNHPFIKNTMVSFLPQSLVSNSKVPLQEFKPPQKIERQPLTTIVQNEIKESKIITERVTENVVEKVTEKITTPKKITVLDTNENQRGEKRSFPSSPMELSPQKKARIRIYEDEVQQMHQNLINSFAGQKLDIDKDMYDEYNEDIYVQSYADFSNKYGLAYKLCNGIIGTYYNDSTKLLWNPITDYGEYIDRSKLDREKIKISSPREELKKKTTLIKYFESYLSKGISEGSPQIRGRKEMVVNKNNKTSDFIYVKRWLRTRHAVLFRLSNRTVQVCFFDNSEILLKNDALTIVYTNINGEKKTYSLNEIKDLHEVSKRLKYTKDLLTQIINKKQ